MGLARKGLEQTNSSAQGCIGLNWGVAGWGSAGSLRVAGFDVIWNYKKHSLFWPSSFADSIRVLE